MELFKVHTTNEAQSLLWEFFKNFEISIEKVPLEQSLGRILAQSPISKDPVPHFNRSTVDGYAVRANDTFGAGESAPAFLDIKGSVTMGVEAMAKILPGQACYVPTGGMVPEGTDAVVMIEFTESFGDGAIAIYRPVAPKENILSIGEDILPDVPMLKEGLKIRPQDIGVLAAAGITEVPVCKKIAVSILSTGDEIVAPDKMPLPGQIRDINTYTLAAVVRSLGGVVVRSSVLQDDFETIETAVRQSLEDSDMVVMSGGSSVGVKDYTLRVLESLPDAHILVHGLAMKPGKPTVIASVQGKPVFGLPGQPASAMMVFHRVGIPFFRFMTKQLPEPQAMVVAVAACNIPAAPGRETLQMVSLQEEDGVVVAKPVRGKSGMITLLSHGHGYLTIPAGREGVHQGEVVYITLF